MADDIPNKPAARNDHPNAPAPPAARRIDRVNDWLHLGGALPPEEYDRLAVAGINWVVDLREEGVVDLRRFEELGIQRQHVPVPDHGAPTIDQVETVARLIGLEKKDQTVYVHCAGGFGRAATMAVGLLVHQGALMDDAIRQVRQARPEMRLNEEQLAWLSALEARRRK